MTSSTTQDAPLARPPTDAPRLVRWLAELSQADQDLPRRHFAERVGRLFDMTRAIAIAATHRKLASLAFSPAGDPGAAVIQDCLRGRNALVEAVVKGFTSGSSSGRIRLILPAADQPLDRAAAFEPYLRFYAAQQRTILYQTRHLQAQTRKAAAGVSAELARLSELDAVLGEALTTHARQCFGKVPVLLRQRFDQLFQQYQQALGPKPACPDAWRALHGQLCTEMQALLLAEIEARLQPTLGLIEAIYDDLNEDHHHE